MNSDQSSESTANTLDILKNVPNIFGIRLEEEPHYQVIEDGGDCEVRKYEPILVAKVTVAAEDEATARYAGYVKLKEYISGGNDSHEKLPMTMPLYQKPKLSETGTWEVAFFIPPVFDLDSVPKPVDNAIQLVQMPSRIVATKRFSGDNEPEKVKKEEESLKEWISKSKYVASSSPVLAQYDPSFAWSFLRRNEVQIEVH